MARNFLKLYVFFVLSLYTKFSLSKGSIIFLILSSCFSASLVPNAFFGITFLIANLWSSFKVFKALICFSHCSSIVFVCFFKCFSQGNVKFVCYIICCWLDGNISSPVRNSYLWSFPDDKADIFAASLLISY